MDISNYWLCRPNFVTLVCHNRRFYRMSEVIGRLPGWLVTVIPAIIIRSQMPQRLLTPTPPPPVCHRSRPSVSQCAAAAV